jgi:hypothetical protein
MMRRVAAEDNATRVVGVTERTRRAAASPGSHVGWNASDTVQVLDGARPANTAPVRVDTVPGTKFRCSGGGTTVVQLALVDQLGKPFPQIKGRPR